ncbi:MAG: hypothetical protein OXU27_17045 [Candidatus Poribacteria bacterium]|nr:hypothetical protein [Candidatus Poribacteria bacterium]MDE0325655.1 hypothetical protein [Candidatus Poribacteria bacterium]
MFRPRQALFLFIILEIDEQLSNGGLEKMTPDEVDALIQSYLDPQRKAAIDALKNS